MTRAMTKDVKTVIGLVSKINLRADPPGMAVGFGTDSSGEDEAFHLLPAEAWRYQRFSASSAEASECGKWTDSRVVETYPKNLCGRTGAERLIPCCGEEPARQRLRLNLTQKESPFRGWWCSSFHDSPSWTRQCTVKLGSRSSRFIFLSAITLSLGAVMLIVLPSFAVCSGDVTSKSYM